MQCETSQKAPRTRFSFVTAVLFDKKKRGNSDKGGGHSPYGVHTSDRRWNVIVQWKKFTTFFFGI
jgi:hypothetical protein